MTPNDDRFYGVLLRLYPRDFRDRYGRAMRDFHRDRLAVAQSTGESMVLLWLRTVADVLVSATAERLRPLLLRDASVGTIIQDLKYAARGLLRRPGFTAIVVLTIALGVGANAAIFSVVSGILLRPLPYPRAEQLFSFGHEPPQWLSSEPDFLDYKRGMKTLSGLAAYTRREATLIAGDAPRRIRIVRASDDFFPILGVVPQIGRTFANEEFLTRVASVIVISHSLWQREFSGDPHVVGRKILIEGTARTVVGVMPDRFGYPEAQTDAWMPLARFNTDSLGDRTSHYLFMVGRLEQSVTLNQARVEARGIADRIMLAEPNHFDPKAPMRPHLSSVTDDLVGNTRPYLLALLGAVGFVLLIACGNVANLLLVRGESRRREIALRSALGASRTRLASQLLTESLLLATIGSVLGLALAWAMNRSLVAVAPSSIPRITEIGIDARVLSFTSAIAIATGLLVGVLPAARTSRGNLAATLKDGGKTTASDGSSSLARRALVVAEIALAVTMLSGAGMLLRSLWHLETAGLGFEARGVLTAKVSVSPREYDDARAVLFYEQLLTSLSAMPGVVAAGASGWLPVVDAGGLWGYRPDGRAYPDGSWPNAVPQQATPGYFAAMRIPIIAGRDFSPSDRAGSALVAVVSKKFAEQSWPGQSAIGERFHLGENSAPVTVVGVVGDLRSRGFGDTPEPTMYFPLAQASKASYNAPRSMALLLRTNGDPLRFADALRAQAQMLDRSAPVSEVRTLERVVGLSVSTRRFNTLLLAGFAILALLLAGIGTYGVIAYGVTQRRFEIGVRMALGAADRSVLKLIMSEGMRLAAVGLGIGLLASAVIGRALTALLVGVMPIDPPSLLLTSLLLLFVAAAASFIPAARALRVSPLDALRASQ